jgi:hypothetical protein
MADDQPNFLLSLQALLDLCASDATPVTVWADGVDSDRLRVAHLTIAQAKAAILRCTDQGRRARLTAKLSALLASLQADGGSPLPFGLGHADVWQALLHEPTIAQMPQVDRQLYAIAVHEGLLVVEYGHAHTAALVQLGVQLHTLS